MCIFMVYIQNILIILKLLTVNIGNSYKLINDTFKNKQTKFLAQDLDI